MRGKVIRNILILLTLSLMIPGLYGILTAEEFDPSNFEVALHRTDLYADGTDTSPMNVFDGGGVATSIDLVSNPGDVFGEGDVPAGTYRRIALTLGNLISVAGTDPCDGISAYAGTFLIDDGLAPDAQVEVFFATADDGGNSMIHARGTTAEPFLLMNPVEVQAGQTTVVRLAFYTSGSLVCSGGIDVGLRPPTLTVASFIEGEPQVVDPSGDYWFVHFNVNAQLYDESSGDWIDPDTSSAGYLLPRIGASTGWGSLTMTAPNAVTGVGTWSIIDADWRNGGFGQHRHGFARWDTSTDDGYFEKANELPFIETYQLTGNHIFLKLGGSAAMEGYIADDGSSIILANIAGVDDSDVVFAVKKASVFPSDLPAGTFVIVSPQMEFRYDTTGTSPYPATDLGFEGGMSVLRGGAQDDMFSWSTNLELEYEYWGGIPSVLDTISTVYGYAPEENAEMSTNVSSQLEFDSSGFAVQSPDDNTVFVAVGGDASGYLGLFAGQGEESDGGEHRLTNGFIVEADLSPSQADLAGRWALMGINWGGDEGLDGTWNTGDEDYEFTASFGILEFDGAGGVTWSFTDKDVITQEIFPSSGVSSVVQTTEYYEVGGDITTPSGTAAPVPLFHIMQSATSSTIAAKLVLDRRGNTILFWSPMDSGNIPDAVSTADAANKFAMGAGVKID